MPDTISTKPVVPTLSRDAEVVALNLMVLITRDTTVQATSPARLNPRYRAALDEMVAAGVMTADIDPRGPITWKSLPLLHEMARDMPPVKLDGSESFPRQLPAEEADAAEAAAALAAAQAKKAAKAAQRSSPR